MRCAAWTLRQLAVPLIRSGRPLPRRKTVGHCQLGEWPMRPCQKPLTRFEKGFQNGSNQPCSRRHARKVMLSLPVAKTVYDDFLPPFENLFQKAVPRVRTATAGAPRPTLMPVPDPPDRGHLQLSALPPFSIASKTHSRSGTDRNRRIHHHMPPRRGTPRRMETSKEY